MFAGAKRSSPTRIHRARPDFSWLLMFVGSTLTHVAQHQEARCAPSSREPRARTLQHA
jgi:hypothetical protein